MHALRFRQAAVRSPTKQVSQRNDCVLQVRRARTLVGRLPAVVFFLFLFLLLFVIALFFGAHFLLESRRGRVKERRVLQVRQRRSLGKRVQRSRRQRFIIDSGGGDCRCSNALEPQAQSHVGVIVVVSQASRGS